MAPVSVIATTTSATGSGSASFGSVVNKFAVVVAVAQPGDGRLQVDFGLSLDGQTYVQAAPDHFDGSVYVFDQPASNVSVSFSGNAVGDAITVTAEALTD